MATSDLPEDLRKKLEEWESHKPDNRSAKALEDIAQMLTGVVGIVSTQSRVDESSSKKMVSVLEEVKASLTSLVSKEAPAMPDYAKPVVEGLGKLESSLSAAISKIDVRPELKPNIKVDAPSISVPETRIDLSGVEKVLKNDIPAAFKEAIGLIPPSEKVEFTTVEELLTRMSEQLESIDTASRLKPQFPSTMKVTNPDGSNVSAGRLVTEKFDKVVASYPTSSTEVYTYTYQNAAVAQVTVTYTDSTKETLTSAERTG